MIPREAESRAALPVHVLVRDAPETLAVLRRQGLDVPALGGQTLLAAAGPRVPALLAALERAVAWRGTARPGPCEQVATPRPVP